MTHTLIAGDGDLRDDPPAVRRRVVATLLFGALCAGCETPVTVAPTHGQTVAEKRASVVLGGGDLSPVVEQAPAPRRVVPRESADASPYVTVIVVGHPELSTPPGGVAVSADGSIALPLIGRVQVTGRELGEVEAEVRESLRAFMRFPEVAVQSPAREGEDQQWE